MDTLAKRIQWILDNRRDAAGEPWNAKSLSQAAGLKSDAHVGMIRRGTAKKVRGETIAAIAKAAGVSVDWLTTGLGSPEEGVRIEYDERYPNRAKAIAFMRGIATDAALRRVQVMALLSDQDLSQKQWADLIEEEDRRLKMQLTDPTRAAEERARNEQLTDETEAEAHARGAAARARRARKLAGLSAGEVRVVPVAPEGGLVQDPATGEWVAPNEIDEDAPVQKGKTKR